MPSCSITSKGNSKNESWCCSTMQRCINGDDATLSVIPHQQKQLQVGCHHLICCMAIWLQLTCQSTAICWHWLMFVKPWLCCRWTQMSNDWFNPCLMDNCKQFATCRTTRFLNLGIQLSLHATHSFWAMMEVAREPSQTNVCPQLNNRIWVLRHVVHLWLQVSDISCKCHKQGSITWLQRMIHCFVLFEFPTWMQQLTFFNLCDKIHAMLNKCHHFVAWESLAPLRSCHLILPLMFQNTLKNNDSKKWTLQLIWWTSRKDKVDSHLTAWVGTNLTPVTSETKWCQSFHSLVFLQMQSSLSCWLWPQFVVWFSMPLHHKDTCCFMFSGKWSLCSMSKSGLMGNWNTSEPLATTKIIWVWIWQEMIIAVTSNFQGLVETNASY